MNIRGVAAAVAAAILVSLGASPPGAEAATTCKLTGTLMEVHMTADHDVASFATAGGTIAIQGLKDTVTCAGGTPTTETVDTVLVVDDSDNPATPAPSDGTTRVTIHEPASFGPGRTPESFSQSEIEFLVDTKGGNDSFTTGTVLGGLNVALGADGLNWNDDDDADVIGMPFDDIRVFGGLRDDRISAQGGRGTGAALTAASYFGIMGSSGDDVLRGSDIAAGDSLEAGDGNDLIEAGAGPDRLDGGPGDDRLAGGPGTDTADYRQTQAGGVRIDLARTDAQETGRGRETLSDIENVYGSGAADTLLGTAGANVIDGGTGDDTLDGRGGSDQLNGGTGTDAVSFAQAPAPVTVDLSIGRTTQGADRDRLFAIEDAIGSPFADTLTGTPGANRIVGGAGADAIVAGAGADRIEVRDGEADRVSCGADADTVIADQRSRDAADGDCEVVDALPERTTGPGTGPGRPGTGRPGTATDRTLSFSLTGARAQFLLRRRSVRVQVSCPLEACTTVTRASGRVASRAGRPASRLSLRPRTAAVAAGVRRTVTLRLSAAQVAALRTAVAAGQRPALTVTVEARDAAGNRVRRTLRVTTKR